MSNPKEQIFSDSEQLSAELVKELLKEKRSDRRWKNFRFIMWMTVIAVLFWTAWNSNYISPTALEGGYVSLIRMTGIIEPGADLSAETLIPALKQAFSDEHAKGVMLVINSEGGTPAQASIIHDAILYYKEKYHKKTIVVGEDFLASGAYYIAVAADQIYVNPNTITGSVGAIIKSFGFPEVLKKIGIERRVYMSGSAKDRMDPFLPASPADVEKANQLLSEVQANFNRVVLDARRNKLHADPATLFNGDFWSGSAAVKLGLVDGLGNMLDVLDKEFQVSRYHDYSPSSSLFNRMAGSLGYSLGAVFKALR